MSSLKSYEVIDNLGDGIALSIKFDDRSIVLPMKKGDTLEYICSLLRGAAEGLEKEPKKKEGAN